jgi:hypothetical protein
MSSGEEEEEEVMPAQGAGEVAGVGGVGVGASPCMSVLGGQCPVPSARWRVGVRGVWSVEGGAWRVGRGGFA